MNPFSIPGLEDDPTRPLCPWEVDTAQHTDYYVNVDHTFEAFNKFTHLINPAGLPKNGRFVLVSGPEGCGKTSLTNRCVHWLEQELRKNHQRSTAVIDVTKDSKGNQSVPERMTQASRRLTDQLKVRNLLAEPRALADIMACRDQPEEMYPLLSDLLNERLVLVVLLPPTTDVMQEIVEYAKLVRGKLVFFVETTHPEQAHARWTEVAAATTSPPISLQVHPLQDGDGKVFSMARMQQHRDQGGFPRLTDEAMRKVTSPGKRSVKFLQTVLFHVYEERRLGKDRYSEEDVVTYEEITDYVFRVSSNIDPGTGF